MTATATYHLFPLRIISGTCSHQGNLRPVQLDRFTTGYHDDYDTFYAGIYDGFHSPLTNKYSYEGSTEAPDHLQHQLHWNIFHDRYFETDPEKSLHNAFLKTNDECKKMESGATAGVILIKGETLYAANTGDVAAFLFSDRGHGQLTMLSQIHTVNNHKEQKRINDTIAEKNLSNDYTFIQTRPYQKNSPRDGSQSPQRSRHSPGSYETDSSIESPQAYTVSPRTHDHPFNHNVHNKLTSQYGICKMTVPTTFLARTTPDNLSGIIHPSRALCCSRFNELLIPNPYTTSLNLEKSDKFIVLATKNLWLVIEPEKVGDLVEEFLQEAQQTCQTTEEIANIIAQKLVAQALSVQDVGNQTVTVIFFDHEN